MTNGRIFRTGIAVLLLAVSCQKPAGNIQLTFSATVDGQPLLQDTCIYENAAGNRYAVTEVQYFISDIRLQHADGTVYTLTADHGAHYVDVDLPGTLQWNPGDELPSGEYVAVTFHFGLTPALNQTGFYPNPPENNMSWPAYLGGGYHLMKINGRWLNAAGNPTNFNLHSGSGQVRDTAGNITGFIDNSFDVTLPLDGFHIHKDESTSLPLSMDISQWFRDPEIFDFNVFGGSIMQNQQAQDVLKANGHNVFSVQ